jgi:hypothetical protein
MRNLMAVVVILAASPTGASAASLQVAASTVSSARTATSRVIEIQPIAPGPATDAIASPASPTRGVTPRLRIRGQKWVAPQLQRSEAGLTWSLSPKVTLELNYERSAMAPTMPHDHDDGFLTRLKLSF